MIKSTAGAAASACSSAELKTKWRRCSSRRRLSESNFKDSGIYLEKFVARGRHIEVQIFGDGKGDVWLWASGTAPCSGGTRRWSRKRPPPIFPLLLAQKCWRRRNAWAATSPTKSAGTVEFIYDDLDGAFYFLEVNTRLQVEHGVTEQVTGIDLVEWMVRQANRSLPALSTPEPKGASIQVRLYAEDPGKNFLPCSGQLTHVSFPPDARVDAWVETGTEVTPYYDPMLAKIIVTGSSRMDALHKLRAALSETAVYGIETNLDYLRAIAGSPMLESGAVSTSALAGFPYQPASIDVLAPGAQSSLQDWPGRLGYWDVGVPPSGPMDPLSHRLANRLVGNPESAAALEMTLSGPSLRFNAGATIALTGAGMDATLDGAAVPFWQAVLVAAGQVLTVGVAKESGNRAYLAVRNGFDVPLYLGSRATFILGRFGGHSGGALRTGDVLRVNREGAGPSAGAPLAEGERPLMTHDWRIGVIAGPHGAPDFFTENDIATLFDAEYEVHFNSARTGVRLIGPKPEWARPDGGEAGLHPSNIHDNAYAVGTLDFTGDLPVILGPDGPSLGGFVCPVTVATAELWKFGQLKPGDKLRFFRLDQDQALDLVNAQDCLIGRLAAVAAPQLAAPKAETARAGQLPSGVTLRQAGDANLLVEFGPHGWT